MSAGEIVRKFYEAAQRKDLAACRALLADDLVFAGLLGITKRIDVKTIVSEGDQAAIFFDLETIGPVEGTTFVAEWHQVRNERIVRVQSAFDGRPWAALFAGR